MTRINLVPPKDLHDKHLAGEYYELPRVFGLVARATERGEDPRHPRYHQGYTRGRGHVLFFYPRLLFLTRRQGYIVREMQRRGFKPKYTDPYDLGDFDPRWCNDWQPSPAAIQLNRLWLIAKKLENPSAYR